MSFLVSNETNEADLPWLCEHLKATYWGEWLNDQQIRRALENSLLFWVHEYEGEMVTPVGFARVVTDHHIFSSITDVYVAEPYRKQGYGRKLMEAMLAHPSIARTICILGSRDAVEFYRKFGFSEAEITVMTRNPQ